MKPLFLKVDSRCKHGEPVSVNDPRCSKCKFEDLIFAKAVPYQVKFIGNPTGTGNQRLTKDSTYTVGAIIKEGILASGKKAPCYLLEAEGGTLAKWGYDFLDFTIIP